MAQSTSHHVSAANLTHYLHGIAFPASKQQLKTEAQKNGAPQDVIRVIDRLPSERYQTMPELMKAFGHEG